MANQDDFSSEEVWDEYKWESFLQEQDRSTEKYFALLEKYIDHPDRDQLIANEMGWNTDDDDADDEEMAVLLCEQEDTESDSVEGEFDEFAKSPIYKDTLKLHRWINAWLDTDEDLKGHPEAIHFATRSAICGAKLAAALCGDDSTEIGMTIAYLKRALKAANDALNAEANLAHLGLLNPKEASTARCLLFRIRDHVVDLMNKYRSEWRKRHGST